MRAWIASSLALIAGATLASCGDGGRGLDLPREDCNPIGYDRCMPPWPSSAFEVADGSTTTGQHLAIPPTTLLTNVDGDLGDPTIWNQADGFSPAAPMIVNIPGGVDVTTLPSQLDFDASLAATSSTVIVDMTTGTRVAHFGEVDALAEDLPDDQAVLLRPAQRLIGGHRYAVAFTSRVKSKAGGALPISVGMQALLADTETDNKLLERMRARFPDVLAALATAGVAKADIVLAWDFTVASDEFLHRDPIAARDRTIAYLDAHPITYGIIGDAPVDDGLQIQRRIDGEFDVPLFLTNRGDFGNETRIARDAAGLPMIVGVRRAKFTAIIPACAYTSATPVGMIMYGHGLMGEATQVGSGSIRDTAAEVCMVIVGTEMRGMSVDDTGAVARTLSNITFGDEVFEVLTQGIINHVTLARAMETTFADTLFVDDPDGDGPTPGRRLVDPEKVFYYGLSQGHIFGTTIMAYEPTIKRAVLGVGGGNYSTMLERSADWPQYRFILAGAYPDPMDLELAISLFQMRWDKTEPSGIVDSVLTGTATGVGPKQLLLHMALGDDQVPNLGTEWQARSMGIPVLTPSVKMPWGLTPLDGPLAAGASALVIFDGGAPTPPLTNEPPADTGAHYTTREQKATRRQMKTFYETGIIENECDGACSCAVGACD